MITLTRPRKPKFKNSYDEFNEGVKIWTSYYRANPHRFALDYFGWTNLKPFQLMLLYLMDRFSFFMLIAARGRFLCPIM